MGFDKPRTNIFKESRRLSLLRVLEIIKEKKEIDMEKLCSVIEFDMGYSYEKAKSMVKVLFDNDKITIKDNIVMPYVTKDKT